MTDITHLICWQCGERSPIEQENDRECTQCGTELRTGTEAYPEKKTTEFEEYIEIKVDNKVVKTIKMGEFQLLMDDLFEVKQSGMSKAPIFVVDPVIGLFDAYEQLSERSDNFFNGLKPKLRYINMRDEKELAIQFLFIPPVKSTPRKNSIALFLISFSTIFFAAMYNYSIIKASSGLILQNRFMNIEFSSISAIYALQFSLTLILLLIIKEAPGIANSIKDNKSKQIPYFIPTIPTYELGTLGNFVKQYDIPDNREKMFKLAFFGPVISWLISVGILVYTINWSYTDAIAAKAYSEHSVLMNKPTMVFKLILNLFSKDLIFSTLILHPISMAALSGIFINGLYLMPISHLNGGYLIKAISNDTIHKLATLIFILIMILIEAYQSIVLILLFLNLFLGPPMLLNEVEPLPMKYKILYIISLLIVFLSIPIF